LVVLVVTLGMSASVGLLRYAEVSSTREAIAVAADLRRVADAATAYARATGEWPPDAGPGTVPTGLGPFLSPPGRADPRRALEWDTFEILPSGSAFIAGVTLRSTDKRLLSRVIEEMREDYPYFVAGQVVTWLLPETAEGGWLGAGG
jgi:hypothetical protein